MVNRMRQSGHASWGFHSNLSVFYAIYRALNRQAELERLLLWATEKNLAGPKRLYENRYADTERVLFRYGLNTPHLLKRARLLHQLKGLLFPPPRYPRKGAAAGYRNR